MAACQFLEEVNLSTITKESEHDYKNNSKLEDKITIPGVSYLSIKFDNRWVESCFKGYITVPLFSLGWSTSLDSR